jgi:hypothetical protein
VLERGRQDEIRMSCEMRVVAVDASTRNRDDNPLTFAVPRCDTAWIDRPDGPKRHARKL